MLLDRGDRQHGDRLLRIEAGEVGGGELAPVKLTQAGLLQQAFVSLCDTSSSLAGLVPAIHVLRPIAKRRKTWMPGTRPGMTEWDGRPYQNRAMAPCTLSMKAVRCAMVATFI